jgi:hypothetical protein
MFALIYTLFLFIRRLNVICIKNKYQKLLINQPGSFIEH